MEIKYRAAISLILFSEVNYNYTWMCQEEKKEINENKCKTAKPLLLFTEVDDNNLILPKE